MQVLPQPPSTEKSNLYKQNYHWTKGFILSYEFLKEIFLLESRSAVSTDHLPATESLSQL